ncbi:MAG TPA: lysyl oxidase family protein [Solirubrobacterales bacterium]
MKAGVISRLGMAALVAIAGVAAIGALAIMSGEARSDLGDELLPDLQVERPQELYLMKRAKAVRLRLSNTISNKGVGPLELSSDPEFAEPCQKPGKPEGRRVWQRIYEDSDDADSLGYFERSVDTGYADQEAGCMRFHPQHDHWHFDAFASFRLYRERNGKLAGRSRKTSFCLIDTNRVWNAGLNGTPKHQFYTRGTPGDFKGPPDGFGECTADSTDGISVGWSDTYGAGLPGQAIDITGVRGGRFCLVFEVDPENKIKELDDTNNLRAVPIRINVRRGKAKRLKGSCTFEGPYL